MIWDWVERKTFVGSEKLRIMGERVNLVICQKSKITDWIEHFKEYYTDSFDIYDLTITKQFKAFMDAAKHDETRCTRLKPSVGIINYDLIFRRPELKWCDLGTMMLDESSCIQNESAKRSKFILRLQPINVILLSGTPTSGKYERLYSQLHLLGWKISKKLYWNQYIETEWRDNLPIPIVTGYKNVERLKQKLRDHGAVFMKANEVLNLPKQNFVCIKVPKSKVYNKFHKDKIINLDDGTMMIGSSILTEILYKRQLCGAYSKAKLDAFRDLVQSTDDRLIVFYNFNNELDAMLKVVAEVEKPFSVCNGDMKDSYAYNECDNSITFVQYQAGAMGLNLQKANKIIYFSPPLSSELYEQSKKRIHRIGQERPCYYYNLVVTKTIEETIYSVLKQRKDFTDELFRSSKL